MIDKFKIRESEKELSNIYREKKTWKDYDESIEERVHIWCTCQVQQPDKFYIYFSIQIKYYVTLQLKNISIIYYKKLNMDKRIYQVNENYEIIICHFSLIIYYQ